MSARRADMRRWVPALLAATLVVTTLSVSRCRQVHGMDGQSARNAADVADDRLGGALVAQGGAYDGVTREALAYLRAHVWVNGGASVVCRFDDRCMTLSGKEDEPVAFVVTASSVERTPDGATYTLVLDMGEDTRIARLQVGGPDGFEARLSCAGIAGGAELRPCPELRELAVTGPDEPVAQASGTSTEALRSALLAFCASSCPTATGATWTGVVVQDYTRLVSCFPYALDDVRARQVTVEVGMATGEVTVTEGGA